MHIMCDPGLISSHLISSHLISFTSETYEILDQLIKLNKRVLIFSHIFHSRPYAFSIHIDTPSLHSIRGPVDSFSLV